MTGAGAVGGYGCVWMRGLWDGWWFRCGWWMVSGGVDVWMVVESGDGRCSK